MQIEPFSIRKFFNLFSGWIVIAVPLTLSLITDTFCQLNIPGDLSANSADKHFIGELYGGGVVVWTDKTGSHGLICSMTDLSAAQPWSDVTSTLIGTEAQNDRNGKTNTNAIVAQSKANSAADLCDAYMNADFGTGIYSDWYLPGQEELNDLWNNILVVQEALASDGNSATTTIGKNNYWSSTEYDSANAWGSSSTLPPRTHIFKKSATLAVRAVRSF